MNSVVTAKSQVVARLLENEQRLGTFGVRRLGLFGSFARDEASAVSDVDVLVEFEPGAKNFTNFMGLSFFLEDLFQRRVEVVTAESLSPHVGPGILDTVEYVTEAA